MSTLKSTQEIIQERLKEIEGFYIDEKRGLFMEYIARRMRKLHPKAEIKEFGDYISFQPINGYAKITLYPIWKEGIKCIREDLSDDVDLALDKIKSNIHKKIYLVYPKSEHFKKHVEIKSSFINPIDCELKVIPYRLSCSFKKRLKDFEF